MRGSQDRDQGVSGLGASRTLAARDAECATDAMVKRRGVKGTRQGINMGHLEAGGNGCEGLRHRHSQTLTAHRGVCLSSLPTLLRRGEGVGVFSQPGDCCHQQKGENLLHPGTQGLTEAFQGPEIKIRMLSTAGPGKARKCQSDLCTFSILLLLSPAPAALQAFQPLPTLLATVS